MSNLRTEVTQAPEQLLALAAEIERVAKTKQDIIVPASKFRMMPGTELSVDSVLGSQALYEVGAVAHEQLGEKLGIPRAYYKRMLAENPWLLKENVNAWLGTNGKNHLLRTLDGRVRAVMSDSYLCLDNYDLFYNAIVAIQESKATLLKADLTEEHMYIRAIAPDFRERIDRQLGGNELGVGHHIRPDWRGEGEPDADEVCPLLTIRNSEVGRGGLSVTAGFFRFVCSNGANISKDLSKIHLGERQSEGLYVSSETRQLKDSAFWSEVKDACKAVFNPEKFREMVALMNNAARTELADPVEAVNAVVTNYGMSDDTKQNILNSLIAGGDTTVWGLLNAVTFQGHGAEGSGDVEGSMAFQNIGGDLLTRAPELVAVRR